jgi:hypothetical protein
MTEITLWERSTEPHASVNAQVLRIDAAIAQEQLQTIGDLIAGHVFNLS